MRTNSLTVAALALAACGGSDPPTNEANNLNAPADIDVLPPDESATTSSDALANGDQSNAVADAEDPSTNETP